MRSDTPPRWWQRAVPLTALVVVGGAVAATAAGTAQEIEVSTSRVSQPFLELSLAGGRAAVCDEGSTARVRFRVTSHLGSEERVTWTVRLDPAGPREPARARGRVRLAPGSTRLVPASVPAPRGPYDVTVRIQDHPELLRVHCRGGRS